MKKILKVIAIILVILALLLLLASLVKYLNGPNILGAMFGEQSWLGSLSCSGIVMLAAVGLLIAAVLSPAGFKKAMGRVTSAVSIVGQEAASMLTKALTGLGKGILKGLGSLPNLLIFGAVAYGIYLLWPSSSDRVARAQARLEELRVEQEERRLEDAHKTQVGV